MKLAGLGYNAGAVLTRQLFDTFVIPTATSYVAGQVLLQTNYQVDPNCPFFYIFAVDGANTGALAFNTEFEFSNGGSILTRVSTAWGHGAALDDVSQPARLSVITTPNDGYVYAHDPIGGTCPQVSPGDDVNGFVKRWSALADKVRVTTTAINTVTTSVTSTLFHGLIQQPW